MSDLLFKVQTLASMAITCTFLPHTEIVIRCFAPFPLYTQCLHCDSFMEGRMKRVATGFAIALLAASGRLVVGQDQQNPFVGRSDNGEIVHVLPPPAAIHSLHATQPTDALAHRGVTVYPASYGSGNLIDHGGHEIALVGYFPIYWNQTVAGSPGSQGYSSLRAQISAFVTSFSQSPDYSVITRTVRAMRLVRCWPGQATWST